MITIEIRDDGKSEKVPNEEWKGRLIDDNLFGSYEFTVKHDDKVLHVGHIEHNGLSGWQGMIACISDAVWSREDE